VSAGTYMEQVDSGASSTASAATVQADKTQCSGSIIVQGYGPVSLASAGFNVPGKPGALVEVHDSDSIVPHMGGRAYFANSCIEGHYDNNEYAAFSLLGQTLRYTTDISGASCGCNAALYLASLRQNVEASNCSDYYCDANSICGVACAEIDIQEANRHAWYSTLHVYDDKGGSGGGYGAGTGGPRRDWNSSDYAPGSNCVDTSRPFEVTASFPMDASGALEALEVRLSQDGRSCALSTRIGEYAFGGRDGLAELSRALAAGMTPVVSYWSSKDMLWMDGLGSDNQGPCAQDEPRRCEDSVSFSSFSVESISVATASPLTALKRPQDQMMQME